MLHCIPVEEHATEEETKGQFVATSLIALEFLPFERWFSSALTHRFPLVFFFRCFLMGVRIVADGFSECLASNLGDLQGVARELQHEKTPSLDGCGLLVV